MFQVVRREWLELEVLEVVEGHEQEVSGVEESHLDTGTTRTTITISFFKLPPQSLSLLSNSHHNHHLFYQTPTTITISFIKLPPSLYISPLSPGTVPTVELISEAPISRPIKRTTVTGGIRRARLRRMTWLGLRRKMVRRMEEKDTWE